jgi:hypothetical protein
VKLIAVDTEARKQEFMINSYNKYISTLKPKSAPLFYLKALLAGIYKPTVGDNIAASKLLKELINDHIKFPPLTDFCFYASL